MKHFVSMIAVLLLALLAACSPKVVESVRTEYEVRDSIIVQVHERLVRDTVTFEIPKIVEKVVVPHTEPSHLENEFAESDAYIDTLGFLHHSLETKQQQLKGEVQVSVADTSTFHLSKEKFTGIKKVTIEKPLTLWQRVRLFGFYILLLALPIAANWKQVWPLLRKLIELIRKFI